MGFHPSTTLSHNTSFLLSPPLNKCRRLGLGHRGYLCPGPKPDFQKVPRNSHCPTLKRPSFAGLSPSDPPRTGLVIGGASGHGLPLLEQGEHEAAPSGPPAGSGTTRSTGHLSLATAFSGFLLCGAQGQPGVQVHGAQSHLCGCFSEEEGK